MGVSQEQDRLDEIINRLESISSIPTIPLVATRAMEAVRNPDSSMRDIAEIISTDPPLAARVLKVVNSAYYGLMQSVGSLPLALTILGIREIMNLVMGVSVMTMFPDSSGRGLFDRHEFWKHSAASAQVGKVLSERLGFQKLGSLAFVGGLLHDIGKIIMDEYMHDEFREAIDLSIDEDIPCYDAESMTVGATHPQIGAWLTKKWKLPDELVTAISSHHSSQKIEIEDKMKQIVYLANVFCTAYEAGGDGDRIAEVLKKDPVWDLCMRSSRRDVRIEQLVKDISEEMERTHFLII
jgi:putative nucleotidyltransferase with HDIG domain